MLTAQLVITEAQLVTLQPRSNYCPRRSPDCCDIPAVTSDIKADLAILGTWPRLSTNTIT